jgi:hypothetical protein
MPNPSTYSMKNAGGCTKDTEEESKAIDGTIKIKQG